MYYRSVEVPQLIALLPLQSYHDSPGSHTRRVALYRCSQNVCDLYYDWRRPCETNTGCYYGFAFEADTPMYCPRHFWWMHYRSGHQYILDDLYGFEYQLDAALRSH